LLPAGAESARELHSQAMALVKRGQLQPALDKEQAAGKLEPKSVLVHRGLSFIYTQLGELDQATAEAQKVVELAPGEAAGYYSLGYALQLRGMQAAALSEYRRANTLAPSLNCQLNIAQCLLALNRRQQAIKLLESLSAQHADDFRLWMNLAAAYCSIGDVLGADQAARKAVMLSPDSYEATRMLLDITLARMKPNQAEPLARRLIELKPEDDKAYRYLADLKSVVDDRPPDADQLLALARHNLPQDDALFAYLAQDFMQRAARLRAGTLAGDWRRQHTWFGLAERALSYAVEAAPGNPSHRLALVEVLKMEHKFPDALSQVEAVLHLDPMNSQAKAQLSQLKVARNDLAGALRQWIYQLLPRRPG